MPTPAQELLGAFCGEAPFHKPRSYTLADWLEVWGTQMREAACAAGMHVWRARGGGGGGGGEAARGGSLDGDGKSGAAPVAAAAEMQPPRADAAQAQPA